MPSFSNFINFNIVSDTSMMVQNEQSCSSNDKEIPIDTTANQTSSPDSTNETHGYPPLPTVLLVMCGLYIAMFLVSLVSLRLSELIALYTQTIELGSYNHFNSSSQNYRRISFNRRYWLVWKCIRFSRLLNSITLWKILLLVQQQNHLYYFNNSLRNRFSIMWSSSYL